MFSFLECFGVGICLISGRATTKAGNGRKLVFRGIYLARDLKEMV